MKIGDHLVSARAGYSHHGIYAGNDWVIHYAGFSNGFNKGTITLTSLDEFGNGHTVTVKEYLFRTYNYEEALERATSRCGEDWYNVLLNNCEHFATWCVMGLHSSAQINSLIANAAMVRIPLSPAVEIVLQKITGLASANTVRTVTTSSIISTLAPTTSALISSGVGAGTGIAASGIASAGLVGLASVSLAPALAAGAAGAAIGYGAKKVWDWLTD